MKLSGIILTLCLALTGVPSLSGADWFVATNGTPSGPGTLSQPYALATALSGSVGRPGDTFWLRGGRYSLGHVDTQIRGAPGQPITFRQLPGEQARIDGSFTVWNSPGYVVFRDFELFSSDTNRLSSKKNAGLEPKDIHQQIGIKVFAPNLSFINLVIHDQTAEGIYLSQLSSNCLVYGCLLFNNGWASPDNASGHNIYAQGEIGTRTLSENLMLNSAGANLHVYQNGATQSLAGFLIQGNVAFHAGAIQNVREYRDWIVGVDRPALGADRIVFEENLGYLQPGLPTLTQVQIGRQALNGSGTVSHNYLPLGLLVNNWTNLTVTSNLFAPQNGDWVVDLQQTQAVLTASWNFNTYGTPTPTNQFRSNSLAFSFANWQATTRFDAASFFTTGHLSGTQVFLRSNLFEPGRAHLIIYNWDNRDRALVDVSSVLPLGTAYELRNAQDFYGPPLLSGQFQGETLDLPLTNLSVAAPNGPLLTPPSTAPTFNVFVLRPQSQPPLLTIRLADLQVQLSWATNCVGFGIQVTDHLAPNTLWQSLTNIPSVIGDRFVCVTPVSPAPCFFRLCRPP